MQRGKELGKDMRKGKGRRRQRTRRLEKLRGEETNRDGNKKIRGGGQKETQVKGKWGFGMRGSKLVTGRGKDNWWAENVTKEK